MFRTIRDLLRTNVEFAIGATLTGIVFVIAALSFVSPYPPLDVYVVPLDLPPGWQHPFGTTSRGQDVFWLLSFAIRNTLLFGISVAIMSRIVSLIVGLVSGYKGGWVDRVLMSINDTFIVIPLLPILVLFYFVMRDRMSWGWLALIMAMLGWAYDARLIRSVAMSLRNREFTQTSVFSGMTTREILVSASICPTCCRSSFDHHEQHELVDRARGHARGARLHRHQHADHRRHDLLGQPAHRDGRRHLVVDRLPGRAGGDGLHRALSARRLDERVHRPAQPPRPHGRRVMSHPPCLPKDGSPSLPGLRAGLPHIEPRPVLSVQGLKAYYRTRHFGIDREVRAVDGIDFEVDKNEIYGLAGESSSGKTTLIKTIAAALRPPLEVVAGTVSFAFAPSILDP